MRGAPVAHSPPSLRQERLPKIDVTRAHTARVWNYWLGGKDHYKVDRDVGEQISCGKSGIATGGFCVCCFSCRSQLKYSDAPLSSFVIK
jgi:S-adenosyl methyltransferase